MKMPAGPLGAAIGLAVLIAGAGLVSAQQHHHPSKATASSSSTSTSSTPVPVITADPTPQPTSPPPGVAPPASAELYWRTVPKDDTLIEAVDATGALRGSLRLPESRNQLGDIAASGDGQRVLVELDSVYHVYSAQGRELGAVPEGSYSDLVLSWADDDTHLCAMARDDSGTSAKLLVLALGAAPRPVAGFTWPQGDGGAGLKACSVHSDLAVVSVFLGDDDAGHIVEYRVLRLSTGRTIRDVRPPEPDFSGSAPRPVPGALDDVVASADGTRLALTDWAEMNVTDRVTTIVDSVSGRSLGRMHGASVSFTTDDTAVDMDSLKTDWRTGRVTAMPLHCCTDTALTRPGSRDLVIAIPSGPPPTAPPTASMPWSDPPPSIVALLHPDGTVVRLAWGGAELV